jgi:hypothetical protein
MNKADKIELPRCKRPGCGKEFIPNHKKQIYCSDNCRQAHWQEQNRPQQIAAQPGK